MRLQKTVLVLLIVFLIAGLAFADTKIVKKVHQDGFSAMGQTQPPRDQDQVIWLTDGKLRFDQEGSSSIVLMDEAKLFVLNHAAKSYWEIDLPVDISAMMPAGTGQHLIEMLKMEVDIQPSDETKKVGEWKARRYDMVLTSSMMTMKTVLWASLDTGIDHEKYLDMYGPMVEMQPGMADLVEKMSSIEGFIVAQEGTMTMPMLGETEVASREETISIEEAEAPAGTYEKPADYSLEEVDFARMMQGG